MTYQHRALAAGRWGEFSLMEQLAHVGSEVERALNWRAKPHADYCRQAAARALELMDLTLDHVKNPARLRELARVREALVDDFFGTNTYRSTDAAWRRYFGGFAYAARRDH